ncbi:TLC domain-containing protein [Podospora aff. communis PSN243]|uniref:TLC domain-containing protein n=1 Tax=Podospora aff. communis PSN243 TaxID=3040156 RepID=A0AAV9GFE5_9PEZI|nr:TLC domain-containing protein [Podospora aff. communis PSN243]
MAVMAFQAPSTSLLGSSSAAQRLSMTLNLRTLHAHIDSILLSTLFFTLLYSSLAEPLSRYLIPKQWASFTPQAKTDWKLRVVSLTQSLILGPASLYILIGQFFLWEPRGLIERVYGYYELETQMTNVALGYFIWHFAMMVKEYKKHGIQMVLHALVGVGCMSGVYVPFTATMTAWFLVYEVTNVPHNIYRFLARLGKGTSRASVANAVVWIVLFFVFRIVWGTYATVVYMRSTYAVWKTPLTLEALGVEEYAVVERLEAEGLKPGNIGTVVMALTMLAGVTLASLNYVWFYLIVKTTVRRVTEMKGRKAEKEKSR